MERLAGWGGRHEAVDNRPDFSVRHCRAHNAAVVRVGLGNLVQGSSVPGGHTGRRRVHHAQPDNDVRDRAGDTHRLWEVIWDVRFVGTAATLLVRDSTWIGIEHDRGAIGRPRVPLVQRISVLVLLHDGLRDIQLHGDLHHQRRYGPLRWSNWRRHTRGELYALCQATGFARTPRLPCSGAHLSAELNARQGKPSRPTSRLLSSIAP